MYKFLCYNKAFKENSYRYSTASDFKRKKRLHIQYKNTKKYFLELTNSKVLSGQSFPKIKKEKNTLQDALSFLHSQVQL